MTQMSPGQFMAFIKGSLNDNYTIIVLYVQKNIKNNSSCQKLSFVYLCEVISTFTYPSIYLLIKSAVFTFDTIETLQISKSA